MEENGQPSSAAASMERKHAAMLERLSNRHTSRLSGKQDHDASSPSESINSFLSQFSDSKLAIESKISEIRSNPDPTQKPELEAISLDISALEKLIAVNSYFLPPYEVRACLNTVGHLKESLEEFTSLIVPKKKFSFKNKSSKKPTPITDQTEETNSKNESDSKLGNLVPIRTAPGFRNRENEQLVKDFLGSESEGQNREFTLSKLRDCEVTLKGCLRALFVDKLVNCRVYVGAVMGSVLIEGAEGCVFVAAAHQIRIHNAKRCDFYLRVRSRPIIEDSSEVRFAPFCLRYQGIDEDLLEANLVEETGNWGNVDDFRWLRAVQSPNWSVIPEDERIQVVNT